MTHPTSSIRDLTDADLNMVAGGFVQRPLGSNFWTGPARVPAPGKVPYVPVIICPTEPTFDITP